MSLGARISHHAASGAEFRRAKRLLTGVFVLQLVASAAFAVFDRQGTPARAFLLGLAATTPFSIMSGLRLLNTSKRRGTSVTIYERGLLITRSEHSDQVNFAEISQVTEDKGAFRICVSLTYSWVVHLKTDSGRFFQIADGSQENFEALYEAIHGGMVVYRAPEIARRLLSGETLTLGRLELDRDAVVAGQTQIPWSNLFGVGLSAEGFVLFDTGEEIVNCNRMMTLLPNWNLLPTIAELIRSYEGQKQAA